MASGLRGAQFIWRVRWFTGFRRDMLTRTNHRILSCFVDESGTSARTDLKPYRVGFLLTCRPAELAADIRALKREIPPRSKTGQYHAREDGSQARTRLLDLLSIHREPMLYVVEWRKTTFSERWFRSGHLKVFSDAALGPASIALAGAEVVASAAKRFRIIKFIAESAVVDSRSEHRACSQALQTTMRALLQRSSRPREGATIVKLSTVRKVERPLLSLTDVWLWGLGDCEHPNGAVRLPASLRERTTIEVYDEVKFERVYSEDNASLSNVRLQPTPLGVTLTRRD